MCCRSAPPVTAIPPTSVSPRWPAIRFLLVPNSWRKTVGWARIPRLTSRKTKPISRGSSPGRPRSWNPARAASSPTPRTAIAHASKLSAWPRLPGSKTSLFMALKRQHDMQTWTRWEPGARSRDPRALATWRQKLAEPVAVQKFLEFVFFEQWRGLREYCRGRRIRIMGDLPIYVAHDSADVWANPQFFHLDAQGDPTAVAGVPPDYFSATGQLWGNPIYRWDALAADGYRWWLGRFRAVLDMVDLVRLDHFRGFEAHWEVPASEKTAEHGRWVKGSGAYLFHAARAALGDLPLVAENLGVITPAVEAIREQFGFPGMSILQFAFGADPQGPSFRQHNYPRRLVAYTGTHDCDTTVGWWTSEGQGESTRSAEDIHKERELARQYLNSDGRDIHWVFIRTLLASVADTVLIPLQDVLGLGAAARMNQPATLGGNWRWRYRAAMLTPDLAPRLASLTALYGRQRVT